MSIWTMPLGQGEAREKALPSGPPSFEQLESRLLLDASLTDPESLLSLDSVSELPAIVVDLNHEGVQVLTSPFTVLPVSDSSASSEPADAPEAILSLALLAGDPGTTSATPENAVDLNVDSAEQADVTVEGSAVDSSVNGNESVAVLPSGTEEPVVGQESSQALPRGPPATTSSFAEGLLYDRGSPSLSDAGADAVLLGEQSDALLVSKEALLVPAEGVVQPLSSPPVGEAPYGATFLDTSEFMIGDVWLTLVLLESNGSIDTSTEDWTPAEIGQVKSEVQEGLTWWEDTLHGGSWHDTLHTAATQPAPLHGLTFHLDTTYADNPVPTSYEPITRPAAGAQEGLWINDFLDYVGYNSSAGYLTDLYQWNHNQRIAHNTEWAYTVFVVDSSADTDGRFSNSTFAFVYVGGPFLGMTYDNGPWGIDNMGEVLTHESTHVFYALDESPGAGSYTDHSGYYNIQNLNAYDGNPDPTSRVISLMTSNWSEKASMDAAYANHTSSPTSLEMIGWKDSDSDGLFDVLDVPLTLDGTAAYSGGQWHFTGTSAVQTLDNLNPNSLGHDITTNTVDLVQYRINGGPWVDGNRYGGYNVNISQNITAASTATVELRTFCEETQVSSHIVSLAGPEVTVLGNGISIMDGDTTPSTADETDFGLVPQGSTPVSHMFTVRNDGTATLTLGAVTVPTGFTLADGLVTPLLPGASDTFTVQLNITTAGTKTGEISFTTNDSDENPFNFTITGTITASGVPAVTATVAPSIVAENGAPNLVYTFARSVVSNSALTVSFSVGGTATYSTDYTQTGAASFTAASGTVIIPANQITAQVTIDPTADTTVELDETVVLTVVAGTDYTVGTPAVATGTIFNDDSLANQALGKTAVASSTDGTLVASNATDGGPYTRWASLVSDPQWIYVGLASVYTINRIVLRWEAAYGRTYRLQVSNDATTWTDVYSTTTGDGGVDDITLSALASGRYVRMYGTQRALPRYGYSLYEFEIYGGGGGVPGATVTAAPSAVLEDGTTNLVYTFTRSVADSSPLTVNFSVSGTATFSTDYTQTGAASFTATAGTVIIPADVSSATLTVDPVVDTTVEPDETVLLTVVTGTGYTVGAPAAATGTIQNDDAAAVTVTAAVAPLTVLEDGTTNLVYTFTRSVADSSPLTVNFSVSGTATFSTDYTQTGAASFTATAGTVTIPAGVSSATLTVDPLVDTTAEPDETLLLTVTAGTGYSVGAPAAATGTIQNDDGLVNLASGKPAVALSTQSGYPATNATDGLLTTRWSSLPRLDPQWIYVDLGAVYTITRIVLRWETAYAVAYKLQVSNDPDTRLPDQSWPAESDVYSTITGDGGVDDIALSTPASGRYVQMYGAVRGTRYGYSLFEFEVYGGGGGGAPAVTVTAAPSAVLEDGATNLIYTFTRSVTDSSALTVNFSVGGTATFSTDYTQTGAASFTATAGTVTIPAGVSSATLTVDPLVDTTAEPDETLLLTVTAGTGYSVGAPATAIGTIQSDDGNLALGKPEVASTIQGGFVASNVTDGNLSSRWASVQKLDPQWIYMDLGAVYTINQIVLRWESAYAVAYQLQVSNDATTWTDVYSTTTGDGGVDDITLSAPATGQYVQMYGTQRGTKFGYSLYEFEVYV